MKRSISATSNSSSPAEDKDKDKDKDKDGGNLNLIHFKRIKREKEEEEEEEQEIEVLPHVPVEVKKEEDYNYKLGTVASSSNQSQFNNNTTFELRLLMSYRAVGAIIGRGGNHIAKLKRDNKLAAIRIQNCHGAERIMTVLALEIDCAVKVLRQTLPLLASTSRGGQGTDEKVEVKLLFHQSLIDSIRVKVNQLLESTGTSVNVKIYEDCPPDSTDRCVALFGRQEKVCEVVAGILDAANMVEICGVNRPYNPANYDTKSAHKYGGTQFEDEMSSSPKKDNEYGDRPDEVGTRLDNLFGNVDVIKLEMVTNGQVVEGEEAYVAEMPITNRLAGAVIGPRGTRIKSIMKESGAAVFVSKRRENDDLRVVNISGTVGAVRRAYLLLRNILRHNKPLP